MTTRVQAAENALASVRAENLDPGVAEALLHRWARGELSDAQLDDAARQISTGKPLSELGTEALALSPGSSIIEHEVGPLRRLRFRPRPGVTPGAAFSAAVSAA